MFASRRDQRRTFDALERRLHELEQRGLDLQPARHAAPTVATVITQFKIKTVLADHLICNTWDGTKLGAVDVVVMKAYLQRKTPFHNKTRWHVSYVYASGADAQEREATDDLSGIVITEVVVPRYVVLADGGSAGADIIYAVNGIRGLGTVDGKPARWLDLTPRQWATKTESA